MKLTRMRVVGAIVLLVAGGLLGYGAVKASQRFLDPYYGLVTTLELDVPEEVRETARQRMAVTIASLEAAQSTGAEIDLDSYVSLAEDALFLGDLVTAREYLEILLEKNPINPTAWNNYGTVLEYMHDYEGALAAYTKAIDNGTTEEYYRDIVNLIETQYPDREAEVEATLQHAVDVMGQTPWLMVKLAQWYEEHGDCQRAEAHMKVAKTLDPENTGIADEYDRIKAECK